MENKVEWGCERVAKWGYEGGGRVRPWEGGWLVGYRCEMGEGDERVMRDQQGKPEMRELESCAWLLVAMWVRELRDEEGEATVWVRELRDEERV